jgi:hypothetical protein
VLGLVSQQSQVNVLLVITAVATPQLRHQLMALLATFVESVTIVQLARLHRCHVMVANIVIVNS